MGYKKVSGNLKGTQWVLEVLHDVSGAFKGSQGCLWGLREFQRRFNEHRRISRTFQLASGRFQSGRYCPWAP